MKWQYLNTFNLNQSWQYTQSNKSQFYRITHSLNNPYAYRLAALVTLVNVDDASDTCIDIFEPKRIVPYDESEILKFEQPPLGWSYRFAIKQLVIPRQPLVSWEVKIEMPVYSLEDAPSVNPTASSTKNRTVVAVGATPVKVLAANPNRKDATFYNPDSTKKIFVDTDSTVNSTSAVGKITAKSIYISDLKWQGEYWAMSESGTINLEVEEYV